MALQIRRGIESERTAVTFAEGELVYITDTDKLYIGDNTTVGGIEIGPKTLSELGAVSLSGNLTLGGNNITGTGNINITGDIQASGNITAGGNIDIGDAADDTLTISAKVDSSITPNADATYNLGSSALKWNNIHAVRLDGDVEGSVFGDDSSLLVDGVNNKVVLTNNTTTELSEGTNLYYTDVRADARIVNAGSANWNTAFGWGNHTGGGYAPQTTTYTKTEVNSAISAINTLDGDLTGSVFADDSTLLVDGISGTIPASVLEGTATINTTGLHTGVVTGDLTGSVFGADSTVIVDAGYGRLAVGGITIGPFTAPVATDPTESYVQPANMAQVNGSLHVLGGPSGVSGGSGGYYSTFDKGIRVLGELRVAGLFRSSLSTNFMPSSNFPTGVTALKMNYEFAAAGSGTWYMYQPAVGVTTNLTGLSEFNDYTTTVNITIYQGSTAVLPPLQIDGVSTGIAWEFNVIPTPTPSSYTVIEYKIMRISNNWYVLGHMGLYG